MAIKTMTKEEIIDNIMTILEDPSIQNKEIESKFYTEGAMIAQGVFNIEFKCETVDLLIALSQKLITKEEQDIFWEIVERPFIHQQEFLTPLQSIFPISQLIYRNIDSIFMFLVKINKIDFSLNYFNKNLTIHDKTLDVLETVYFLLKYEPAYFDKRNLDLLRKFTGDLDYKVFTVVNYQEAKEEYERQKRIRNAIGEIVTITEPKPPQFYVETPRQLLDEFKKMTKEMLNLIKERKLEILKSELSGYNFEVNQDKKQLQQKIKDFNFNPELNECLDRFDLEYEKGDKYDMKNGIGHIRSFIEKFVVRIAVEISQKTNISPSVKITKMGEASQYFRDSRIAFLTENEDKCLYGIFSACSDGESGVHALASDREHARLLRNMAVEFGLFLVKRLEKFFNEKNIK